MLCHFYQKWVPRYPLFRYQPPGGILQKESSIAYAQGGHAKEIFEYLNTIKRIKLVNKILIYYINRIILSHAVEITGIFWFYF